MEQKLPLCETPLSRDEAIRLEACLMPLVRFLNAPGDWGYETKLGRLTQELHGLRADIINAKNMAIDPS